MDQATQHDPGGSRRIALPNTIVGGSAARFSECGQYRYTLERHWDPTRAPVCWVMLNPSTADLEHNDPTVHRCQRFADRWGYGGIVVVNLFAYRATAPECLKLVQDPIGSDNDAAIAASAAHAHEAGGIVVCAWGNHGRLQERSNVVVDALLRASVPLYCLKVTGANEPGHPLYLRGDSQPRGFL